MRNPFSLVDLALMLALASVAVVGYKLSPLLLAKADVTVAARPGCDLNRSACAADLPGDGRVELAITPRPVPLVKPLQIVASVSGVAADRVDIDFSGQSMDMGYQRQTLTSDGQGRYRGEAMLPVCVSGRMVWQATLIIESRHQRIAVPFLFEAPTDGQRP